MRRAGPAAGVRGSSAGVGMGQPLFSFQDKLGPFLCFALPVRSQEGSPAPPAWGEELRDIAKQAPGVPVPDPRRAGWSWRVKRLEKLGAGSVPPPRRAPGCGTDILRSHLRREDGPVPVPELQGRRRSQRDVRRRLQALPRRAFLGAAAGLVPPPVRVVAQIYRGLSSLKLTSQKSRDERLPVRAVKGTVLRAEIISSMAPSLPS